MITFIHTNLLFYLCLFVITLLATLYNLIYAQEVYRIEKNSGIAIPLFMHKLLKGITIASFILLALITIMALALFFTATT